MKLVKGLVKLPVFISMILLFILQHEFMKLILRDETKRLRFYSRSIGRWCRAGLFVIGIKVEKAECQARTMRKLIVSNHLSYIDALVYFAHYPSLFITSVEIRDTFLLGHITKLASCFFIERRKARRTPGTVVREMEEIKSRLLQGFDVFLFPEGTTSEGTGVLPFKAAFFQTAVDCDLPVLPLTIKYSSGLVPWYGDMTFFDHLFKLLMEGNITCRIFEGKLIFPAFHASNVELARFSQQKIQETYATN